MRYTGRAFWVALAVAVSTLAVGGAVQAQRTSHSTACQEDQRCFDCATMGNADCGRVYPVKVTGSRLPGFRVRWSDGSATTVGGWEDIQRECSHDDDPATCLAVWRTYDSDLATMEAMIR